MEGIGHSWWKKAELKTTGLGLLFCRAGDGERRGSHISVPSQPLHLRGFIYLFIWSDSLFGEEEGSQEGLIYAQTKRVFMRHYLPSQPEMIYSPDMSVRMLSAANNRTLSSTALNNKGNLWAQFLKSVVTQIIWPRTGVSLHPFFSFFFGFAFWVLASFLADYCLWDPDTADGHFWDDLLLDSCK